MSCEDEKECEYEFIGTYDGRDQYECPECGYCGPGLEVPHGEKCPECPVCRNPPDLMPCPFCGSPNIRIDWNPDDDQNTCVWVGCDKCGCNTGLQLYPADAAAMWNARYKGGPAGDPPQGPPPGRLECRYHTYRGNSYSVIHCTECGYDFYLEDLEDGDPIECPECREIRRLAPTLKPCPFCGGQAEIERRRNWELDECYSDAYYYVAYCTKCGIKTSDAEQPDDDLATVWNRRASEDPRDG